MAYDFVNAIHNNNIEEVRRFLAKHMKDAPLVEKIGIDRVVDTMANQLRGKAVGNLETYFKRVQKSVTAFIRGNLTLGAMLRKVSEAGQFLAKYAPQGIARDVIGTINNLSQRLLFTAMGFNAYVWQTSQDERVRGNPSGLYPKSIPSHFIMQGIICRWDNDLVYSEDNGATWKSRSDKMEKEQPGVAWGCRCVAIPYILPALVSIDRSL